MDGKKLGIINHLMLDVQCIDAFRFESETGDTRVDRKTIMRSPMQSGSQMIVQSQIILSRLRRFMSENECPRHTSVYWLDPTVWRSWMLASLGGRRMWLVLQCHVDVAIIHVICFWIISTCESVLRINLTQRDEVYDILSPYITRDMIFSIMTMRGTHAVFIWVDCGE